MISFFYLHNKIPWRDLDLIKSIFLTFPKYNNNFQKIPEVSISIRWGHTFSFRESRHFFFLLFRELTLQNLNFKFANFQFNHYNTIANTQRIILQGIYFFWRGIQSALSLEQISTEKITRLRSNRPLITGTE